MTDFTHYIVNADREDVINEILKHIDIAFRIMDVQDCITIEEYTRFKEVRMEIKKLLLENMSGE